MLHPILTGDQQDLFGGAKKSIKLRKEAFFQAVHEYNPNKNKLGWCVK